VWGLRHTAQGRHNQALPVSNASSKTKAGRWVDQIFRLTYSAPFLRPGMSIPGDASSQSIPLGKSEHEHPVQRGRLRKSLRLSTVDGLFSEVIVAFTQGSVLTAWTLFVGGGTFLVGLLAAMPYLSQLFHLPAAWVTSMFGRRRVTFWSVLIQRQAYWLLVPLPFLGLPSSVQQTVLVSVALTQGVMGVIGNNAWVSWMGDLVPENLRGRYFGRRNAVATFGGTLAALTAGLTMDHFQGNGSIALALSVLSGLAAISGMVTSYCLWHQHEPHVSRAPEEVNIAATLRPFFDKNVRPFLTYQATWNFAVATASSFIPIHMVQNLKMGFALVAVHASALAFCRVIASPFWGRLIDKVGARPVLVLTSFGICSLPFIWLFPAQGRLWPVFLDAFISGTLWSGHAVAIFSLPFAMAPAKGRPFYLAAFTATAGSFYALASTFGGAFAESLPSTFILLGKPWNNVHVLFFASFVFRLVAASLTLRLHEPESSSVRETVRVAGDELGGSAARLGFPLVRR
jgi:MFS family permease